MNFDSALNRTIRTVREIQERLELNGLNLSPVPADTNISCGNKNTTMNNR